MSREKNIKDLENFLSLNTVVNDWLMQDQIHRVAEQIIDEGWHKQEWISVNDMLPDCEQGAESEAVLFITKQGFMYTGYYGCGGIYHDRYFREYKNSTDGCDISNVTHWMPLPEPPKGE